MTPFGTCTRIGPTSSGRKTPRPPPSIIAGPPMPMFESAVAMMTSQQPSSAALPAKQRPEVMPTSGDQAGLSAARRAWNGHAVEPGDAASRRCRPGRPPPPSAKNTTGSRHRSASSNMRSFLRWFCDALRAGQHRVVVGHDDAAARPSPNSVAVDAADAGDQAVGRACARSAPRASAGGAGRPRPASRTRRRSRDRTDRRRSRARCAGRSRRRRATASGRASSRVTAWRSSTSARSGADRVEVDVLGGGRRRRRRRRPSSTNTSGLPSNTVSPARDGDLAHDAADRRRDRRAPSSSLP